MPSKAELRAQVLAARDTMNPFEESQDIGAIAECMYSLPVDLPTGATIAAYVATSREPGGIAMLDALTDQGFRVLLPVVPQGDPQPLMWGVYEGERQLETGRWNLLEPLGPPWLEPDALLDAQLVLVPAVAVDRRGARLGRGAGYYDRTLANVTAPIVAVVNNTEVVDFDLPEDANDVRVNWILTPAGGFEPAEG